MATESTSANPSTSANLSTDEAIAPVPMEQRQHWTTPAIVFGGLEFTIPVLMVGAVLAPHFSLGAIAAILAVALLIQWVGNTANGYMGAVTGRSSSVIARSAFGRTQARFVIGTIVFIVSLCWWAIQTAVAGDAISAMLGIDYTTDWGAWAIITVILGLLFAAPSVIGYSSMKWTDYLAVPGGLLLMVSGFVLALRNTGIDGLIRWAPEGEMTVAAALTLVIGTNVAQWLIAADYTRYAKPSLKDNIKIPLGIVVVGYPLFFVGAVMAVGVGQADIVQVMVGLGFAFWGFIILWLATWTSQLVNNYSMGLALANVFNINSGKGRAWLTFAGTLLAIALALAGFLDYFTAFLNFSAIIYAATAGVIMADFFVVQKRSFSDALGWNWWATLAISGGIAAGALTQYVYPFGIPPITTLLVAGLLFTGLMRVSGSWPEARAH